MEPPLFALIPTSVIAAPLAILAMLFPAVFGGLGLVLKRWRAYLAVLSLCLTLAFLYDVWPFFRGLVRSLFAENVSDSPFLTLVVLLFLVGAWWAWRRQLNRSEEDSSGPSLAERRFFWIFATLFGLTLLGMWLWSSDDFQRKWITWKLLLMQGLGLGVASAYLLIAWWRMKRRTSPEPVLSTEGLILGATALCGLFFLSDYKSSFGAVGPTSSSETAGRRAELLHGKPVWQFYLPRTGEISSTPLITDRYIYATVNHGFIPPMSRGATLYCIDPSRDAAGDDAIVWTFNNDGRLAQMFSSPKIHRGRIYFGEGFHENRACHLFCLDAETGAPLWAFPTTSHTESTPAFSESRVVLGAGDDGMFCLDADTGQHLWQYPDPSQDSFGLHIDSTPVIVDGLVICSSGVSRTFRKLQVFALDLKTGRPVWTMDDIKLPAWGSPVVRSDRAYIGLGNGRITISDPVPAGEVLCVDVRTGQRLWRFDRMGDAVHARAAVDDFSVYVACRDGICYCLDARNGRLRWKTRFNHPLVGAPALVGCSCCGASTGLYVVSYGGEIACLDPLDGQVLWTYDEPARMGAQVIASPTVRLIPKEDGDHRRLYVAGEVGGLALLLCLEDRWLGHASSPRNR